MSNYEKIVLQIDDTIKKQMEDKGIREEEIKMVIGEAEETGVKLRNAESTHFMAKLKIAEVFYYAEYEVSDEGFKVTDAYNHTTAITGW